DAAQDRIIAGALGAGRREFLVLPRREGEPMPRWWGKAPARPANTRAAGAAADRKAAREANNLGWPEAMRRFAAPNSPFEVEVVAAWNLPFNRPNEQFRTRGRRTDWRVERRVNAMQVVEVRRREGSGE